MKGVWQFNLGCPRLGLRVEVESLVGLDYSVVEHLFGYLRHIYGGIEEVVHVIPGILPGFLWYIKIHNLLVCDSSIFAVATVTSRSPRIALAGSEKYCS